MGMIDRGGVAHRLGVGIGCVLGTLIIALVFVWIITTVLGWFGVVV